MTTPSTTTGAWGVGRLVPTHPGGVRRVLLRVAVAAVLIPLWFAFLAPRTIGGPLSTIWVSGTSMEPTLVTGDLAVLYRADAYEVGDIVAFEIPEGGTVIHRIIEVTPDGYRFQGDNRDFHDPWVLGEGSVLGRQVVSVPQAARVMTTVLRPEIMAALAVAFVVFWRLRRDAAEARADEGQAGPGGPDPDTESASRA